MTTGADATPAPDTRDEWRAPVGLGLVSAICVIVFQLLSRPLLTRVVADVTETAPLEAVLQSKGVVAFGWLLLVFLPAIVSVRIFKKARTDIRDHRRVTWRRTFWFPTLWACLLASVFWVFAISAGFSFT